MQLRRGLMMGMAGKNYNKMYGVQITLGYISTSNTIAIQTPNSPNKEITTEKIPWNGHDIYVICKYNVSQGAVDNWVALGEYDSSGVWIKREAYNSTNYTLTSNNGISVVLFKGLTNVSFILLSMRSFNDVEYYLFDAEEFEEAIKKSGTLPCVYRP